jgi:hypothetical protein
MAKEYPFQKKRNGRGIKMQTGQRPIYICQKDPSIYSPLEKDFMNIIESDTELKALAKELNLLHEWHISGKTAIKNETKQFHYWMDFFVQTKAVDIEINHDGHRKGRWYMPKEHKDVFSKDKDRKRRLERLGIKTYPIFQERLTKGWIKRMLLKISQLPNTMTLDYYLKDI